MEKRLVSTICSLQSWHMGWLVCSICATQASRWTWGKTIDTRAIFRVMMTVWKTLWMPAHQYNTGGPDVCQLCLKMSHCNRQCEIFIILTEEDSLIQSEADAMWKLVPPLVGSGTIHVLEFNPQTRSMHVWNHPFEVLQQKNKEKIHE